MALHRHFHRIVLCRYGVRTVLDGPKMRLNWNYALIVAVIAIILIVLIRLAYPAGGYPPIGAIATELNLSIGQQLPKGVIWQGRPFFFYIVSAHELANGEYEVRLKAR